MLTIGVIVKKLMYVVIPSSFPLKYHFLKSFLVISCVGTYKFIGRGTGIGRKGKKITYAEAWKGFERSFTSARIPCNAIERYPTVARWRNDVDYVAAGT